MSNILGVKKNFVAFLFGTILISGCNANVDITTLDSGAPIAKADIKVNDSTGKTMVAQGPTAVDGSLKINLPFGDYKIIGEKVSVSTSGAIKTQLYDKTEGFLHVDLMGSMFGIKVELPMKKTIKT